MKVKAFFIAAFCVLALSTFASAQRVVRVVGVNGTPGMQVTVPIEMVAQGDEVGGSFSIAFDRTKLSNTTVTLGSGVPQGTALTLNPNELGNGKVGVLFDAAPGNTYVAGVRVVINVRFDIAANAPPGPTILSFTGFPPTSVSTSDSFGNLLPTTYEAGAINIGAAAANYDISGTVFTPSGQGLRNATVVLTDSAGVRRTVITSAFGGYQFLNVAGGQTYTISVQSRRFRFPSRQVTPTSNLTGFDFQALE